MDVQWYDIVLFPEQKKDLEERIEQWLQVK